MRVLPCFLTIDSYCTVEIYLQALGCRKSSARMEKRKGRAARGERCLHVHVI